MAELSVEDAYRNILGREPDAGGLDYWKSRVGNTFDANELDLLQSFWRSGVNAGPDAEPGLNTDWYSNAYDALSGNTPEGFELPPTFNDPENQQGASYVPEPVTQPTTPVVEDVQPTSTATDANAAGAYPYDVSAGGGFGVYTQNNPAPLIPVQAKSAYDNLIDEISGKMEALNIPSMNRYGKAVAYNDLTKQGYGDEFLKTAADRLYGTQSPESWQELKNAAGSIDKINNQTADMYRQYFGRDPDEEGLSYWRDRFISEGTIGIDPNEVEWFTGAAKGDDALAYQKYLDSLKPKDDPVVVATSPDNDNPNTGPVVATSTDSNNPPVVVTATSPDNSNTGNTGGTTTTTTVPGGDQTNFKALFAGNWFSLTPQEKQAALNSLLGSGYSRTELLTAFNTQFPNQPATMGDIDTLLAYRSPVIETGGTNTGGTNTGGTNTGGTNTGGTNTGGTNTGGTNTGGTNTGGTNTGGTGAGGVDVGKTTTTTTDKTVTAGGQGSSTVNTVPDPNRRVMARMPLFNVGPASAEQQITAANKAGNLTTEQDKISLYRDLTQSGFSDTDIRAAATKAVGPQTSADWQYLRDKSGVYQAPSTKPGVNYKMTAPKMPATGYNVFDTTTAPGQMFNNVPLGFNEGGDVSSKKAALDKVKQFLVDSGLNPLDLLTMHVKAWPAAFALSPSDIADTTLKGYSERQGVRLEDPDSKKPVGRAKGSPPGGESSSVPSIDESGSFVPDPVQPQSSAVERLSQAVQRGLERAKKAAPEVAKDVVRGVQYTPFDMLGAPVDIATMVMRPFGYNVEKPVGGSDYLIEQASKLGLAQPQTNSAGEIGGRILGGIASPGLVSKVGKTLDKAETAIRSEFQKAPVGALQVGKAQATKAFDEADNLPPVDFDETPEGKDIVGQIRSAWIGGVGDFGNPDAAYTLFQFPEGREYVKQTQNIAQKTLGNEFMGYRLMSREQFEQLQAGDLGDLMSFSLSRQAAENLRNFAPNQKRADLVVVEAPLTPKHVVMFGSRGEQEVVVDSSVGWDMSKMKILSGPIQKQDLDTSLLAFSPERPFVGGLEQRVAELKGPMTKSQFLGFLKNNQGREHEMVRARQALEAFDDNDKLSPAQIMEAIRPTSPNRYKLQIVEPSQKNQKDFYQNMDNPYPSNPIGTVNLLMDPNQQQKQMQDLYNKAITESSNVLTNLRQNQAFDAQAVSDTIDELYSVVKGSDPRLPKQKIIEYKNELVGRLSDFAEMQKLVHKLLSGTDLFTQKTLSKDMLDVAKSRFGYSDEQLSQLEAGTKPRIGLLYIDSLKLFEELAQKQKEFLEKNDLLNKFQKAKENAKENALWKKPILEAIEADKNGLSIGLSVYPQREAFDTLVMGPNDLPEVRDVIDNVSRADLRSLTDIFERLSSKLKQKSDFYEGGHPSVVSENPISFARFVDIDPQTYNLSDPRGAMFFTELQSDRYRDVKPLKVKLVEKTITDAQGNTVVKRVPEIDPATGKPVMIENDKYKPDLEPAYPGMADISSDLVQQLIIKNAVVATTQRGKGVALFPSTDSSQAQLYENVGRNVKQVVKDLGPGFKAQQFDIPNEKGDIIKRWGIILPPDAQSIVEQKGVRFAKGGFVDKALYDRTRNG